MLGGARIHPLFRRRLGDRLFGGSGFTFARSRFLSGWPPAPTGQIGRSNEVKIRHGCPWRNPGRWSFRGSPRSGEEPRPRFDREQVPFFQHRPRGRWFCRNRIKPRGRSPSRPRTGGRASGPALTVRRRAGRPHNKIHGNRTARPAGAVGEVQFASLDESYRDRCPPVTWNRFSGTRVWLSSPRIAAPQTCSTGNPGLHDAGDDGSGSSGWPSRHPAPPDRVLWRKRTVTHGPAFSIRPGVKRSTAAPPAPPANGAWTNPASVGACRPAFHCGTGTVRCRSAHRLGREA